MVSRIGGSANGWLTFDDGGDGGYTSGPRYTNTYASAGATAYSAYTGGHAHAKASYTGRIDLTQFPNYWNITRVVVYRYGYGVATIWVSPGQTYVDFTDYQEKYSSVHGDGVHTYSTSVEAKAGIYA